MFYFYVRVFYIAGMLNGGWKVINKDLQFKFRLFCEVVGDIYYTCFLWICTGQRGDIFSSFELSHITPAKTMFNNNDNNITENSHIGYFSHAFV